MKHQRRAIEAARIVINNLVKMRQLAMTIINEKEGPWRRTEGIMIEHV
jgi:hypothetical protein